MTLQLAATPELKSEAQRAVALLQEAGVDARTVEDGVRAHHAGGSPLNEISWAGVDAVLLPMRAVGGVHPVTAVLKRDEPSDVLLARHVEHPTLRGLPAGARVGVAGPRRRAFLRAHRPDVVPVPLENGHSPPEAFAAGHTDIAIMAAMDARRAGLEGHITEAQDPKGWLPAPQQGAVALVMASGLSQAVHDALNHGPSRTAATCEGAVADLLDAWRAPLGVLALPSGPWIRLWAMLASTDGRRVVRGDLTGRADEPEALAALMANQLRARGADEVLSS